LKRKKSAALFKSKADNANDDGGLPNWSGPAIRALCKALDCSQATPHVYAGLTSILKLQTSSTRKTQQAGRARGKRTATNPPDVAVMIAAITIHVVNQLVTSPIESTSQIYERQLHTAFPLVLEHCDEVEDEEAFSKAVGNIMMEATAEWLDMDWWANVESAADAADAQEMEDDNEQDGSIVTSSRFDRHSGKQSGHDPFLRPTKQSKLQQPKDEALYVGYEGGEMLLFAPEWTKPPEEKRYNQWAKQIEIKIQQVLDTS
jgi:hypothetical protein